MRSALERRQRLLVVLSVRKYDTVANLAYEFMVSVSTIYRDIEIISEKHPIYTMQGKGGGVHYMHHDNVRYQFLSDKQCALLKRLSETLPLESERRELENIIFVFSKPHKRGEYGDPN